MANTYMPVSIKLNNRKCLVVGGGRIAIRKIDTLLDYGADITVVAPDPIDRLEYYDQKGLLKLHKRAYEAPEATRYGLVISATDDEALNESIYETCREKGIPINVVDNPKFCDLIFPAVVKRDCLTVSVSSDGKAPFLSGHLRMVLENIFPEKQWEQLGATAARFRIMVQDRWADDAVTKANCFSTFLNSDWK
ncbi:MAG: bifunctional precorrin-2 dehydrogenase/sirohydrochlorin ferrochelatase, partial [candidate division Zixibacteria bacterium]|nr:bifunctional precorrin-2 dehydrogenase/sirohydrochlorin ferrochelatase [candidate division Zixibacteria bacterium]